MDVETQSVEGTRPADSNDKTILLGDSHNNKNTYCKIFSGICIGFAIVIVIIVLSILLPITKKSSSGDNELVVDTTNGPVKGFYLKYNYSSSQNAVTADVKAWRGIPYAAPPVRSLRWLAPTYPEPWTSPLLCQTFGSQCVQPIGDPMQTGGNGTEDCLYLNVYTYSAQPQQGLLPVLFYMHGGGLMAGAGIDDMTPFVVKGGNGSGMVLVQINYRLNLFGFFSNPSLSQASEAGVSGNYGIQDQLFALQWVQNNIKNFGGDPSKVTISGQSSGGTSVFALLSSPMSKGLFSGAISLSGSPNISTTLLKAEQENVNIFNTTNCTKSSYSYNQINSCLRSLNATAVQEMIPASWNTPGLWGMPKDSMYGQNYDAVVIVDGVTVTNTFEESLAQGLIQVPLLFGNMAFEPDEGPDVDVSGFSSNQWLAFVNTSFAPWGPTVGRSIYDLYVNNSNINPQSAYDAIVSDYGLTCASVDLGLSALPPAGQWTTPLYVYYNQWGLSTPYVVPDTDGYISRFAHHDVDYWMLTESWTSIGNGTYQPTPTDLQGSAFQQNLWYTFISNGGNLGSTWATLNSVQGWPANYSINVIDASSPGAPIVISNLKSDVCNYFSTLGINTMSYWWCN